MDFSNCGYRSLIHLFLVIGLLSSFPASTPPRQVLLYCLHTHWQAVTALVTFSIVAKSVPWRLHWIVTRLCNHLLNTACLVLALKYLESSKNQLGSTSVPSTGENIYLDLWMSSAVTSSKPRILIFDPFPQPLMHSTNIWWEHCTRFWFGRGQLHPDLCCHLQQTLADT